MSQKNAERFYKKVEFIVKRFIQILKNKSTKSLSINKNMFTKK